MDLNKAIESIEKQLKEFVGNRMAVIGLSGGIDSTVIAYLCARALGKENVIGIVLPYGNQSVVDGSIVASELDIRCCNVNIEKIVDAFPKLNLNYFGVIQNQATPELIKGNIMARVRMVVLYEYANAFNGFVIGTTNKTEAMIGYYTKYGDGAVDVEPIADIYKTEVWEMAKILGVPQQIIDKKPSAELWANQTDEDEFGMTYQEMDKILIAMEKGRSNNTEIAVPLEETYGRGSVEIVKNLIKMSEHKRHLPPSFDIET